MRASDVSARLAAVASSVCEYLLPNGKRHGHEWCVGSTSGDAGKSLKVCMTGPKAGIWADFASGESGDLLDLWCHARSVNLATAITEAKQYLGIAEAKIVQPARTYSKPSREGVQSIPSHVAEWLSVVRKITPHTVATFKLAAKKGALMFPYIRDGEWIGAKYRKVPAKEFYSESDCEPCLFGWQALPESARAVMLVEGEMDALAMYEYGIAALSVPCGGGKAGNQANWIAAEFERMARFDVIYLALDSDETGKAGMAEIISRLGRERCRVVKLPYKDANECLIRDVPRETILQAVADAKTQDPEQLRNAAEYGAELIQEFADNGTEDIGIRFPWRKLSDRLVLRMGEVSIMAGFNGHGKTELAGNLLCGALADNWPACVASLEFKPVKWLKRLTRQLTANKVPPPAYLRYVTGWFRDRLWVFDVTGKDKAGTIIEVFAYAAKRYGIKLFIIDNLAKCGFGEDDYNGQKGFVEALADFAKTMDAHVCLVHHMRKTDAEDRPGGKMDIKGTGGITDMADTVLTIWRNKPKEKLARNNDASPEELAEKPDAILQCHKQRNGEDEPTALLWFDRETHQFLAKPNHRPRAFVGFSVVENRDEYGRTP